MTRSTERSAPTGESTARTSTVFIVAKDPAMHFGDTKPAFAGHGAVLLEALAGEDTAPSSSSSSIASTAEA